MVRPDLNFRPNPERGVYVFGALDDALLAKIIPEINQFRYRSKEPITVFINSPGGVIRYLEVLMGCLGEQDIAGHNCRIITVATGDAASAAASLLSLGDYAYAYQRTEIHFHGARFFEVDTVTTESASTYAAYLANRNRQIAFRLASPMVRRLAHRYSILCDEFEEIKKSNEVEDLSDLECFVRSVLERVGERAYQIVTETFNKTKSALDLSRTILANISLSSETNYLEQDVAVFKAVIDYEAKRQVESQNWRLDEEGCSQIVSDYLLLRDYELGEHRRSVDWIAENLGIAFLTGKEFQDSKDIDKQAESEMRKEIALPRIKPFWYFTVCLCRQLQEGENRLSASDAYWLGAVDEVIGTQLFGIRALMEAEPDSPKIEESSPPPAP